MPRFAMHLLCAFLLLLAGCSKSKDEDAAEQETAAPVQVSTAVRGSIPHVITAEAIVSPFNQAVITPKISAPVARFLVQRGDRVTSGQLVAVLEERDLAAAAQESKQLYQQAKANYQATIEGLMPEDLIKARTDVESARQGLAAAQKVFDNRQSLFQQGALAQKLVDDARLTMVQARSQLEVAQQHLTSLETVGRREQVNASQAQLDAAKARADAAAAQLSYAQVRSPIAGLVSDRPINVGEIASSGSALMTIVDISHVFAKANVPVQAAASIAPGCKAIIKGAGVELPAKIAVVSPAVDPNTTTVQIWAEAANPGERLKLGTTVQIAVDAGQIADAISVPVAALLPAADGGDAVLVAEADSLAHKRVVKTGIRSGDQIQIVSGVKEGEQVIVEGGVGLEDKAKIKISKKINAGETDKSSEDEKK